jgi:GNAT superfamily N-acetyltransferase
VTEQAPTQPAVPYFPLKMALDDLSRPGRRELPAGYGLSLYRPGDENAWVTIERAAGEFLSDDKALARFEQEFGPHLDEMRERCLFLHAPDGRPIGTTTAWYGEHGGRTIGRLHWVAIVPAFQGRGLAKPLVSAALALMRRWHASAYLTTQTPSWIAVKVYLDLGFVPVRERSDADEAWALVARLLDRPALARRPL